MSFELNFYDSEISELYNKPPRYTTNVKNIKQIFDLLKDEIQDKEFKSLTLKTKGGRTIVIKKSNNSY